MLRSGGRLPALSGGGDVQCCLERGLGAGIETRHGDEIATEDSYHSSGTRKKHDVNKREKHDVHTRE